MKISCQSLDYRYPGGEQLVFSKLDITFPPQITLLKGYSGCGKSTLLRLAAGFLKPTAGKIIGEDLRAIGSQEFFRKELSFVFQDLNLLPLASVERNLKLSSQISGSPLEAAAKWLEILGLSKLKNRPVERLSGGQRQRVAIARALAKEPKVLFLDEPTSGLDDGNTAIIKQAVQEFSASGKTICVMATHDQRLEDIADDLVDFHSLISVAK